ncbi:hypothetical protein BO85DRAFT_70231 [Aspergillus piperis CBS 112811]|uniref:Uncharacterized protein n=1 Tax=Aspergillus piperis CBS 112811 TaxID=1448313 RepID=A0A8G1R0E4_9EURO|nr:hypothetical protein BO85DRAFT_70231 [Aspergillus piperis CBS 112811]RAH55964.1 hypothetical protein BO85DRAFT_70231 [Aspergillus piperis CBS 112811]
MNYMSKFRSGNCRCGLVALFLSRTRRYHHSLQMWGLCTRYISHYEKRSSPAHSVRVNQLTIKVTGITLLWVSTLTVYSYFISPLPPRSDPHTTVPIMYFLRKLWTRYTIQVL